ncbi:hypothetical protein PsalN5692_01195 [Piscirickettsia salmonis]|uniref:hypothetical protein n=1 Tax=Piscirickettsia salmonis TaxID=1238 RepID=UPI0012B9BA8B|nr:hypothetical protein [Piscirickettsia salmonis]QGP49743.1 hypothetical protein PsalN5692_01195 [Piscirickettsia salmonis]
MPKIKPITVDSGAIAHSYQSSILATGPNYGDSLLGNVAIIAQSKRGYGLFHATGLFQSSENFIQWLQELKNTLGNRVALRIIDPQDNQPHLYKKDLEQSCRKIGITPVFFNDPREVSVSQPVAVSHDDLILDEQSLLKKSQETFSSKLKLNKGMDRRYIIFSINRSVEHAIEELQAKIEKGGLFPNTKERNKSIEELKNLQKTLNLLAKSPGKALTEEFLKIIQTAVNEHYDKSITNKRSDTITKLFKELKKDFIEYTSSDICKKPEDSSGQDDDLGVSSSQTSIYSDIKLSGSTPPAYPRQHPDGPEVHYSEINFKGEPGFTHTNQKEDIFGAIGDFQPRHQGASGHSNQAGNYEASFQQQSSTPKALPKGPVNPNATYATVDLTKKHTDRAQKQQQDLQSSTLFMRQSEQNQQSTEQSSNYRFKK